MLSPLKKLIEVSPNTLARVYWLDAYVDAEAEMEVGAKGKLSPVVSAGFLAAIDSEVLTITFDYFPEGNEYRGIVSIPLGWVIAVELGDGTLHQGKRYKRYANLFHYAPQDRKITYSNRPEYRRTPKKRVPAQASSSHSLQQSPRVGSEGPLPSPETVA